MITDHHGREIKVGDRVEAYSDEGSFFARIAKFKSPHPGCEGHIHLAIIREGDDTESEIDRASDAVVLQD